MTQSPTITEFQTTVREAFDYLAREFGCREIEPPRKDVAVSPFLVCFANATTLVQVEGTNYGFGAEVIVGPAASWKFWQSSVPLWAIVQHRRPELCDQV